LIQNAITSTYNAFNQFIIIKYTHVPIIGSFKDGSIREIQYQ